MALGQWLEFKQLLIERGVMEQDESRSDAEVGPQQKGLYKLGTQIVGERDGLFNPDGQIQNLGD